MFNLCTEKLSRGEERTGRLQRREENVIEDEF